MFPRTPASSVRLWQCEQAHVLDDVLEPVEEEDDADEKQQMVVAGDHVLRTEVHERADGGSVDGLYEGGVAPRDAVRFRERLQEEDADNDRRE